MVYVFLAEGFEEIEALCPIDIMRRAGIDVVTVSVPGGEYTTGSHNITIKTDLSFEQFKIDEIPKCLYFQVECPEQRICLRINVLRRFYARPSPQEEKSLQFAPRRLF